MAHKRDGADAPFPRVVVLDLDGTIWTPEMYELWGGGGAPFRVHGENVLADRSGTKVRLFNGVLRTIQECQSRGVILGVASTTDEPEWAKECLRKFTVFDLHQQKTVPMGDVFHHVEIYKANKKQHLTQIKAKSGVAFEEILFIDNEYGNVRNVASLGVKSYYAADGLTLAAWEDALEFFRKN